MKVIALESYDIEIIKDNYYESYEDLDGNYLIENENKEKKYYNKLIFGVLPIKEVR